MHCNFLLICVRVRSKGSIHCLDMKRHWFQSYLYCSSISRQCPINLCPFLLLFIYKWSRYNLQYNKTNWIEVRSKAWIRILNKTHNTCITMFIRSWSLKFYCVWKFFSWCLKIIRNNKGSIDIDIYFIAFHATNPSKLCSLARVSEIRYQLEFNPLPNARGNGIRFLLFHY